MRTPAEPVLTLRPLTTPDLPSLAAWIDQPHVSRWWHDPVGLAPVSAEYQPSIDGTDPTHTLIAELDGRPVGFAQWYRWWDYPEHAVKAGTGTDEAGLDYLIGDPAWCGRGLGTRLIAALIARVRAEWPAVGGVLVDPEVANHGSRRVLEKNGLRPGAIVQLEESDAYGPSLLYRLRFGVAPSA